MKFNFINKDGTIYITNDMKGWKTFMNDVKLFPKISVMWFFENGLTKQKVKNEG